MDLITIFVQVSLTVLVRPGAPTISPRTPVATEGQSLNLTCSSVGGSPAPDIFWYREGDSNPLHGHVSTQGRLTTSSLEIVPEKDDDGVSYRCTVWNRAMGRRQRLDTALRLHVKCRFLTIIVSFVNTNRKFNLKAEYLTACQQEFVAQVVNIVVINNYFRFSPCSSWTLQPSQG